MTVWQFAATFFYLGKLPFAPGTWGSLGALILWIFLPLEYSLQLIIIILLFIVGVISSKNISMRMDNHDPSESTDPSGWAPSVVTFVPLCHIPATLRPPWATHVREFLIKLSIIHSGIEQSKHGGDDEYTVA